jgi:hypothetical protein
MLDDIWANILAAVGLTISGLVVVFREALTEWIKRRFDPSAITRRDVMRGLQQYRRMNRVFAALMEIPRADRVILFAAMNSGGLPKIDTPFFWQAVHGENSDPEADDPVEQYGSKRRMDKWGVETCVRLESEGRIVLEVEKMPPCKLKEYYGNEGVKHSVLFFVGIADAKFLYASIATYGDQPFGINDLVEMELQIDNLREIAKESIG